jgi:hypothetical protein
VDLVQIVHDANVALEQAWCEQHGAARVLSYNARTVLLGVAWSESNFGRAGTMAGTNNWGAIQCTDAFRRAHPGAPGFECFQHLDHTYDGQPIRPWFRGYPNQLEAARDFLRFLWCGGVPEAAESGDAHAMAVAMWGLRYYTGTRGTPEERQAAYAKLLAGGIAFVRSALAQPRQPEAPHLAGLRAALSKPKALGAAMLVAGVVAASVGMRLLSGGARGAR